MNRADALAQLNGYAKDQSLVHPCLSVEAAMRAKAHMLEGIRPFQSLLR